LGQLLSRDIVNLETCVELEHCQQLAEQGTVLHADELGQETMGEHVARKQQSVEEAP
jgi:hypothetical protein